MRIDTKSLGEFVMGTVVDGVIVVARNTEWRLRQLTKAGRAEVIRCRGTVKSGAQCKRRPVADSAYCFQHRDQAKSDGRLLVVIEARDKAVRMTSDLSQKTLTATASATSRLAELSPRLRAQVLSGEQISRVRQAVRRMVESLQTQRRWVTSVMVLALVIAVPITFLTVADGDLSSLTGFAREILSRNPPSVEGNLNTFGRQETPTAEPNAAGLLTLDETRTPGTDFAGAYVSGVEHLSANSSMLQILVPAGVEGTYLAVVTASEGLEYQCVILHHYADRLYCVGALLPDGSQISLQIYRIDEIEGSESLVFETNYTIGDLVPPAFPTPEVPAYGGAFTWPDRFDKVEIRKEQQSSAMLSPLSALLGVVLLLMYRMLSQREHQLDRRLVESHEFGPFTKPQPQP